MGKHTASWEKMFLIKSFTDLLIFSEIKRFNIVRVKNIEWKEILDAIFV